MQKILIGIPTYPKQEFCLDTFCEHLKALEYPFFDILFVVDQGEDAYQKKIKEKGFACDIVKEKKSTRIENITNCRKYLRKKVLEGNYTHLMFIDSDVMVEPNILNKLVAHDKPLCSGVFLSAFMIERKPLIAPVLYDFAGEGKVRLMMKKEILGNDLKKIAICGFGCCLIQCNVLENINFRHFGNNTTGGEDAAFCHDAAQKGFSTWVDCSVKTWHHSFAPGDKRNEKLKI